MSFRKSAVLGFLCFLLAACGLQMSPSKDPWFAQHYYIMQDFEQQAYKSLSSAAKLEFQKLFWEARAPQSRQEFDNRTAVINETFKRENSRQPWNTDRSRVYLLNGKPAQVEYKLPSQPAAGEPVKVTVHIQSQFGIKSASVKYGLADAPLTRQDMLGVDRIYDSSLALESGSSQDGYWSCTLPGKAAGIYLVLSVWMIPAGLAPP